MRSSFGRVLNLYEVISFWQLLSENGSDVFRVHPKTSMASALPLSISALTRSQSVRIYPLLYLQYSVPYCCIKMYTVRIPAMANSKFNSSIILKPKKKAEKTREKTGKSFCKYFIIRTTIRFCSLLWALLTFRRIFFVFIRRILCIFIFHDYDKGFKIQISRRKVMKFLKDVRDTKFRGEKKKCQ